MTKEEFNGTFPYWKDVSPRNRWRLYRINNEINLQETGEECTYDEFADWAKDGFRWSLVEASILWSDDHSYFVQEALKANQDVPAEVLAEYPSLVEDFLQKRAVASRIRERRNESRRVESENKRLDKENNRFWSQFR